jgi:mono/diheme cytochrome c family protein
MPRARDAKGTLNAAAVCLALAATAAGCATRAGRPPAASGPEATRTFYERNCATCHGRRGEGQQLGTMRVPSLREGAPAARTDEELFRQIAEGGKGMPPFKHTLDDRQIQDLVRFIREEIQK